MTKQSEMANNDLFEDLLEKLATGRRDEIIVPEIEECETYSYLVTFERKTEQKTCEVPYEYECTGKLFFDQMKEIEEKERDDVTNIKLFAVKPSGERVLLAE